MSATIFTGWHLLTYGTATNIILVGAAVLVLRSKVRESRDYMAAGDAAFAQAEQRDAAFEETRNKPWYWPTGPAIEADKPHDAEVLHVAYPTQELRLVADDPQVAAGLAVLADEVGLVQALSDRPAEDEVGDEPDRTGMWRVIGRALLVAAVVPPLFVWSWCVLRPLDRLRDAVADWQQTRRERDQIGSGGPPDDEPWVLYDEDELREQGMSEHEIAMLREGFVRLPDIADEDELQVELEAWVAANPPTNPPYKTHRCLSDEHAVRESAYLSRHVKPGFETGIFPAINVPTQRTGDADV